MFLGCFIVLRHVCYIKGTVRVSMLLIGREPYDVALRDVTSGCPLIGRPAVARSLCHSHRVTSPLAFPLIGQPAVLRSLSPSLLSNVTRSWDLSQDLGKWTRTLGSWEME